MTFSPTDFRHCMGQFATGVAIATTRDSSNQNFGITINSFSSVSLHPPMVLFCLDKNASYYQQFTESGSFNISLLTAEQEIISCQFATPSNVDWNMVDFQLSPTHNNPVIANSLAYVECETAACYEGGDHSIILGEVKHLEITSADAKPLLYFKGQYTQLS